MTKEELKEEIRAKFREKLEEESPVESEIMNKEIEGLLAEVLDNIKELEETQEDINNKVSV